MCGSSTQPVFVLQEQKEITSTQPKDGAEAVWALGLQQVGKQGTLRHSQATCSAFHPTLINSKHQLLLLAPSGLRHTALTSPFLLQSSKSCSVKYRAGWQRELQNGSFILPYLQAAEMCSSIIQTSAKLN